MYSFDETKISKVLLAWLRSNLLPNLFYHSVAHTEGVISMVQQLARLDGLDPTAINHLQIAAAGHDIGFTISAPANEPFGAELCAQVIRMCEGYTLVGYKMDWQETMQGLEKPVHTRDEIKAKIAIALGKIHQDLGVKLVILEPVQVEAQELAIAQIKNMIRSTALMVCGANREQRAAVYRVPLNEHSRYLLDADLAVFGQEKFRQSIYWLMQERDITGCSAQRRFLEDTLVMMEHHIWFTNAANSILQPQMRRNMLWLKQRLKQ